MFQGGGIIHIVTGAGGHDSGSSLYELPANQVIKHIKTIIMVYGRYIASTMGRLYLFSF